MIAATPFGFAPLQHCLVDVPPPGVPTVEVLYLEDVGGKRVFPIDAGDASTIAIAGTVVLDAPSSATRGFAGHLDVTLTDASQHRRKIRARIRFEPPKQHYPESKACAKRAG